MRRGCRGCRHSCARRRVRAFASSPLAYTRGVARVLARGPRMQVLRAARVATGGGEDDDDDYSPLLDPLAWSVDYVACPRDVCVTHDLRATLCDPDRSVP